MEPFVLDASVAVAWLFVDESAEGLASLQRTMERTGGVVPANFHLEVANTILRGERLGRLTGEEASIFLGELEGWDCAVDPETARRATHSTAELAKKHRLSVYDTAYLELAIRRKLRLATLDRSLHEAAVAEGVAIPILQETA